MSNDTNKYETKPEPKKKTNVKYYVWLARQGSGRIPSECSPQEQSKAKCQAWFDEAKEKGTLGACTYQLVAVLAEVVI